MKNISLNRSLVLIFLVGIFFGILIVGSTSVTVASGPEMTICVTSGGVMHLIGDDFKRSDCKKNEKLLTFNAVGQQGPQGIAGVSGKDGTVIPCVHVEGNDVYFDGCNVHIRSGSGSTLGAVNGLGNLIIGYNEDTSGQFNRTGSHNLVIGPYQTYSSFGGIVAGQRNIISAGSASVIGGTDNVASAAGAVVSGGSNNTSSGNNSSVSGGTFNTASGDNSSVSGGKYNEASGNSSSVSGGDHNTATASQSSVSGGHERSATGIWSWIAGALSQAN